MKMSNETNEIEAKMIWGSCQYDVAAIMFQELLKAQNELGGPEMLKRKKIDVSGQVKPDVVYDKIANDMITTWTDDDNDYMLQNVHKAIAAHPEKTISSCFSLCRDMSWDLWSAAPTIAKLVFPNFNYDALPETPDDMCFGPILNRAVQSENIPVAFCCWILNMLTDATEDDFTDFDT